jgi:plasmid stabilization system protein ParE
MNPRLSPGAADDIAEIVDWLDQQPLRLGTRFRGAVNALVNRLCTQPRLYGRVNRAPRGREVRVARVRRFSYLVHYEVTATEVVILSVTHTHRRSATWRQRLGP